MTTKHDALFNALSPQKAWKDLYVPLCNILETSCGISIAGIHRLIMAYARLPILLCFSEQLYMFDPVQNGMVLVPNVPSFPNPSPRQIFAHNNYLYVINSTYVTDATGCPTNQTIHRSNLNSIVQFEQKPTTPIEWELFLRFDDNKLSSESQFERFAFWRGSLIAVRQQKQKGGDRKLIFGIWNPATQTWDLRSCNRPAVCTNQNEENGDEDEDSVVGCLVVDHDNDTLWIASQSLRVESIQMTEILTMPSHCGAPPPGEARLSGSTCKSYKPKEDWGCCWYPYAVRTGFIFSSCQFGSMSFSFQTKTWEDTSNVGIPGIEIHPQYDPRLCETQFDPSLFLSFHNRDDPEHAGRGYARCITNKTDTLVIFEGSIHTIDSDHLVYI
jgi:hypothetical protein